MKIWMFLVVDNLTIIILIFAVLMKSLISTPANKDLALFVLMLTLQAALFMLVLLQPARNILFDCNNES